MADEENEAVGQNDASFEDLSPEVLRVDKALKSARKGVVEFRKELTSARHFMANYQWEAADEQKLNAEDRPTAVFNYAQKYIRAVVGAEQTNRQSILFASRAPTAPGANAVSELANSAMEEVMQNCDGEAEQSAVFEDEVTGGMGWSNVRLDTESELDGKIVVEHVDPAKMWWDASSRKQNVADARWIAYETQIPVDEAIGRWPDKRAEIELAEALKEPGEGEQGDEVHHVTPIEYEDVNETPSATLQGGEVAPKGFINLVEFQYYEVEPVYRVAMPELSLTPAVPGAPAPPPPVAPAPGPLPPSAPAGTVPPAMPTSPMAAAAAPMLPSSAPNAPAPPKIETLDQKQFDSLRRRMQDAGIEVIEAEADAPVLASVVRYVRQYRRRYHRIFKSGRILLEKGDLPTKQGGFTYKCATGWFDWKKKVWRGMLYVLMDPQRFANKFFSSTMHIINSNSKGGYLMEASAAADPGAIEASMADPSKLILLEDGALSGDKPRIVPREKSSLPQGTFTMLQYSVQALGDVSGINPETLGAAQQDLPATLQRQRVLQSMMVNAPYFTSFTRYLKANAILVFEFIRTHMSDGRLVRIGGPYNGQMVPLLREALPADVDIIIDESIRSPNAKEVFWEKMTPILPILIKKNIFPAELMDYAPAPATITAKIKQQIIQGEQMAAQQQQSMQGRGARPPQLVNAEVEQRQQAARLSGARAAAIEQNSKLKAVAGVMDTVGSVQDMHIKKAKADAAAARAAQELRLRHGRHMTHQVQAIQDIVSPEA